MLKILKIFYRFFIHSKALFGVFFLLVTLSAILSSITPYFYKLFVDEIPELNFSSLLLILVLYVGFRILNLFIEAGSYIINDKLMIKAGADVRTHIFKHVQDLDFAFHTEKSTGSLISAFKRGDGAFFSINHAIHHRVYKVIIGFIVMLIFFIQLNALISIISVVSLIIVLAITRVVIKVNIKARNKLNKEEDKVSAVIVDNMINYDTVKLFAKEDWEQRRLEDAFKPWKERFWKFGLSFRLFDFTLVPVLIATLFLILFTALQLAVKEQITVGDFVLVAAFISIFFPRVYDLLYGLRDIAKNFADLEKYFGLLDQEVKVKDPKISKEFHNFKGEIEFKKRTIFI